MVVRRPFRAIAVGALGTVLGAGLAAALMVVRLRISQGGVASMALAWLLAQGAQVAIGWGRAVRIEGLTELSRADAADREKTPADAAPAPQVVHSATLSALDPPTSGAPR
jgi:hypothetical protein